MSWLPWNTSSKNDPTSAVFNSDAIPYFSNESSDCFGIDFGNSNICVGYYQNQQFRIVQLENKTSLMPAVITFQENDFLVGKAAVDYQTKKATKSTFFDIRRILSQGGASFDNMPFTVSEDLVLDSKTFPVPVVRAIALLFQWIKNKVEADLLLKMNKIVLTVPTGFNLNQRQIMVNAARIVNLEVMQFLNEPTAAALTYFTANPNESKTICVLDFGSAKLDIAVIRIDTNGIELVDCSSDLKLGGRDFDEIILTNVCKKISEEHPQCTLQQKHVTALRSLCTATKVNLSSSPEINMEFEIGNFEISIIMERKEMETICEKLFKVLETNLRYLSEKYNDVVSEVLLIGGSTRIPKVQEIVKNAFPCAIINKTLNADEAVARGAATYATSLAGMIKKLNVIDHVPWDNESVKRAQKMEYIIDPKGIVQKKVCEYADLVEIKYENEKNEIEKLFERKKQLASQKSVEKVENSSQIVRDAEKLLVEKNNQDLQKYAKQITNLLERASIEYHLSNISNGNDHLEKLKTRVPRIQIYLRMLETTKKCSLKGFKEEASEIEKISGYLQDYCLDFADDVFRAYKVYLETCNYWLDLKDKIEEFEKKQTSKTKGTLLNIKKATTDVKTSLKSFERHAVAIVVDNKYIEELIEKFNTELQEHNLNQQLTIC